MIAPNACGGKGFTVSSVAAAECREMRDHAFVKRFIMLPDFGPAAVHVNWDKAPIGFGSVRVSDSSAPQPPGTCAGRL